jgi:putative hydrolase of the HAD superfamily
MSSKYDHIILDFGGVIYNINYHLSVVEFEKLGFEKFDEWYSQAKQHDLFDSLETGKVSELEFYNEVRKISGIEIKNTEIELAWNSLLIDLPISRIELLKQLSKRYELYLLSNTNFIHARAFKNSIDEEIGWNAFAKNFKQVYLSHEINKRKPDTNTFEFVIETNKLNRDKTLFVDDSKQHIEGAKKTGIDTYFLDLKNGDSIENLFSKLM